MRLLKVLFKKCFRDIARNIKQFISVIFIIAISCTLYIGLESNAKSFENRVNIVFNKGHLSDLWVTINPDLNDLEQMDNDVSYIETVSGENSELEKRLFLPSNILSYSVSGLISPEFPKINTAYDLYSNKYTNNDFFFVDKTLIEKYEVFTGNTFDLGDSLPVTFQSENIKTMLLSVANNEETVRLLITSTLKSLDLNEEILNVLEKILTSNIPSVQNLLIRIINEALSKDTIKFDLEVNGVMSHPENIENGTFSSSSYLLSSRLLLNTIVKEVGNSIKASNFLVLLEELKSKYESNVLISGIIENLINLLKDENNQQTINMVTGLIINDLTYAINNKTNDFIEKILSHLYNQICLILDKNVNEEETINQIIAHYKKKENNNLLAVLNRDSNASIASTINDITQAKQLTLAFPIIFFVVAILIVLTTLSQLILRERTQIGTLKAIGISKTKILTYYLTIMNLVGVIGVAIGMIIGPLIIPNVLNIKYSILYSLPAMSYTFPALSSFIVLLIILFTITVLTILLTRKELQYSASESMRAATPSLNFKTGGAKIKNTSFMMAIRNIKVHFTKSIMVVIGVLGCTALLICGMGIDDTIDYGKNLDIKNVLGSDITVNLNVGVNSGEAKEKIEEIEGVNYAEEYSISQAQVVGNNKSINTAIYFINSNSKFFTYDDQFENKRWDKSGIAISEQKAKKLGVKKGDELTFNIGGKNRTYKISEVFYVFSANGVYCYKDSYEEFNVTPTNVWVDVKDGYDHLEIKEKLMNELPFIYSSMTYEENMNRINGYMSSVSQMTLTIKIFAILLAVIVLINLAILNFNERKRDIATLRVLGFSKKEIAQSLVYEVMLLTTLGTILGLFFGLPMEMIVLGINKVELIDWKYMVYPISYFISFLISFLTALGVNLFISSRINKISMSESLKSVE